MKVFFSGLVLLIFVTGCATGPYVSKHAIKDPAKAMSLPDPVEMEKLKSITMFNAIMASQLWPEVVVSGGVWPALAYDDGKVLEGNAYLASITYWGDFLLGFIFQKSIPSNAKIIYLNRDGGWLYQLNGKEVSYDPKKFDEDKEYQKKMFSQYGWTLSQLDEFWVNYFKEKKLYPPSDLSSVCQLEIGTPEWEDFKGKMKKIMKYRYQMGNGEARRGYLPLEEFRQAAVVNPGLEIHQKFVKNWRIPFVINPIALIVSVANAAVTSSIDSEINGPYARAKVMRRKMAPVFKHICHSYKQLLEKRDQRIERLESRVFNLKILNSQNTR